MTARACKGCGGEVPPGRRSWCGDACVEEWTTLHWWAKARAKRIETDAGTCQICGRRAVALEDAAKRLRRRLKELRWRHCYSPNTCQFFQALSDALSRQIEDAGFDLDRSFVEVDHIHARADGGDHSQHNLRTLCRPCHRERTRAQTRERAESRRRQRTLPVEGGAA